MTTPTTGPTTGSSTGTTATGATATGATGVPGQRAGERDDRSLGQVVGDVASDLSELFREELTLAKAEMRQEATRLGKGAGMLGGAGVAGLLFLVFASWALAHLLDNWLPIEAATGIVALLWGIGAAVLALRGKKNVQKSNPQLPRTQGSLKEDAAWVRPTR